MSCTPTIHGGCVVVAETGILIRGASGSGKSSLAAALIRQAEARGLFGCLVADDRVVLERRHGRLIARPHPSIAGRLEVRGVGLVRQRHEPAAVVRVVFDLDVPSERLPASEGLRVDILGLDLPCLPLGGVADPAWAAMMWIDACQSAFDDTLVTI